MSISYDFIITTGEGLYTPVDARNQEFENGGSLLKKQGRGRFGLARWFGILLFAALSIVGGWAVLEIFDVGVFR